MARETLDDWCDPDRRAQLALEGGIRNSDAWWAAQLAEAVRMLLDTDPCA